ncbi:cytochrome P450 78A3 [Metarhizium acridum CQMa 102]|uniref:Cytochrome P450 78A3 n=1 Tax=Metarhizium acridum (strain CQMa 102) TaxID=655827 RepID=E9E618_METAQ|nr:cytochrome P450 78A3 [Metarhizium acridum CQMa 102]EFY88698.1 cytochrome P450 78A3 [Metarhizium acridum CQMa 102]
MQRRNLMPAFAFRHIKDLYPVFWRKAREVVQAMSATANSDGIATLDALDWANRCTLDIIGLAGMGVDFGSIQDPTNPLATTYKSLTGTQGQASLLGILLILLPAWLVNRIPLRSNNVINNANRTIRNVCRELIRDKKCRMANKDRTDVDILSVALESGLFSDENLVDQLMTFLAAGHDTTASALTWATYALSCYPDVQTRLRDEVRERLPRLDADADITSADIDKMPYLNAVCNEVLRFFSPVPRTSREAVEDTTVQGYPIPKGSVILLSPWATNVDQNLWGGDALEFKPERWLAKDAVDTKSASSGGASCVYAFLTFLHGPRSCIGASFAKSEFACLLAAWVGRFEFALVNDEMREREKLVVRYGVTARPKGGLPVRARVVPGF